MNPPDSNPSAAESAAAAPETSLSQDLWALLKHWLRGRRGWLALGAAAGALGLWLGWPALAAAGLAPILIGVLPCVAMCAVGVCAMRGGKRSCGASQDAAASSAASVPGVPDLSSPEATTRKETQA